MNELKQKKIFNTEYTLYSDGRVINKHGRTLKPYLAKIGYGNGYLYQTIIHNNKRKAYLIHRLLAIHFIDNPNNLPQVNHIDGNSLNNDLSNLEWCTAKENIKHAWANGLCKPHNQHGIIINSEFVKDVTCLRAKGLTQTEIAKIKNVSQMTISNALKIAS